MLDLNNVLAEPGEGDAKKRGHIFAGSRSGNDVQSEEQALVVHNLFSDLGHTSKVFAASELFEPMCIWYGVIICQQFTLGRF